MQIQPYLNLDGRCEEALGFYQAALGAEVTMLMRFRDHPEPKPPFPPGSEDKVMHACLRIGGAVVMASDMRNGGSPSFRGFDLSLSVANDAEAQRCFAALSEGGTVLMPLQKTFWASSFGTLTDRFGVPWMVTTES